MSSLDLPDLAPTPLSYAWLRHPGARLPYRLRRLALEGRAAADVVSWPGSLVLGTGQASVAAPAKRHHREVGSPAWASRQRIGRSADNDVAAERELPRWPTNGPEAHVLTRFHLWLLPITPSPERLRRTQVLSRCPSAEIEQPLSSS